MGCHAAFWRDSQQGMRTMYAVSYTHLRAHETVLDLVCRLLLEKKNENTAYHEHTPFNNLSQPTTYHPLITIY